MLGNANWHLVLPRLRLSVIVSCGHSVRCGKVMASHSAFTRSVLIDLENSARSSAKNHSELRHMLVLPPGEFVRIPTLRQFRNQDMPLRRRPLTTCKFGATELVGSLPTKALWPNGMRPYRAVSVKLEISPFELFVQYPIRLHLFFGQGDRALRCFKELADKVSKLLTVAGTPFLGDSSLRPRDVFFLERDKLHGKNVRALDLWLCTIHWWAWYWTDSPFGQLHESNSRDKPTTANPSVSLR